VHGIYHTSAQEYRLVDATPRPPVLAGLRRTYEGEPLLESDLASEPIEQFTMWFQDALEAGLPEPNAMVLATASAGGRPSARTVLLKGYDERGFVFYTNYESRKGRDLAENARASLLFPWHPIRRQIRIEGTVTRISHEESAAYYNSRPYGSRIGAWASRQSAVGAGGALAGESAGARLLGRFPGLSDRGGVLAGAARPDARQAPLPADETRLGPGKARALMFLEWQSRSWSSVIW
jgi:pyridoxamine-phosphate oxidase